MEINGEYQIDARRETVWRALNDPEMLKNCIPGCDSIEKISDTEFDAKVTAAIGPVRAKFNTSLSLEDLNPPVSYRLVGESKAAAGFGRGSATVELDEKDGGTLLRYNAEFNVGGKLAQVGSRLVLGATKKTADQFFGAFSNALDPGAERVDAATVAELPSRKAGLPWPLILAAAAAAVLLIGWILLR